MMEGPVWCLRLKACPLFSTFKMLIDKLPPFPQTCQGLPSFCFGISPLPVVLSSLPALTAPCHRNVSRSFISCMLRFTCCKMVGLSLVFWSGALCWAYKPSASVVHALERPGATVKPPLSRKEHGQRVYPGRCMK